MAYPQDYPPMNEYEAALFAAVSSMMVGLFELGANPNSMIDRLTANEQGFQSAGKLQAAATVALLSNAIKNVRK